MEDAPGAEPVPLHLRDASYPGARQLGHGKGYRYPHDFPGHVVEQEYRPAPRSRATATTSRRARGATSDARPGRARKRRSRPRSGRVSAGIRAPRGVG